MGGDHSPAHEVDGAVMAARRWQIPIVLVGQSELLAQELANHDTQGLDIRVEHASEVVGMHDSASDAVRRKKDSSIRVAFNLLKEGRVNAVVSAGNSGATMAVGMFVLKRIKGIDRPAIATVVPNLKDQTLVLDVGGNVDCKPPHLVQFALMGSVYASQMLGKPSPRVGLLSNGAEESKGNELTREANQILKRTSLNYVGYTEGRDIYNANVDVVVCDGFVGNVVLVEELEGFPASSASSVFVYLETHAGSLLCVLADLVRRVHAHDHIEALSGCHVTKHKGYVGNFQTTVQEANGPRQQLIEHGVVIIATGGEEYAGSAYGLGTHPQIMTQEELEARIYANDLDPSELKQVVMIQCVGPWDEPAADGHTPDFYCSRVCCTVTAHNAAKVRECYTDAQVYVLHKDVRTYGFREQIYTEARERGVTYIRFDDAHKPQVEQDNGHLTVTVIDPILELPLTLEPDVLVLSAAMVPPAGTRELSEMMRYACTLEGFMLEAHLKLQPVDFPTEGAYLCGAIQYPKFIDEAIAQAKAAAARASAILSQDELQVGGQVAVVETEKCTGCLTCVRVCPYDAPIIDPELVGVAGIMGAARIAAAACRGCGICAGECPAKAIQLQHYRDEQVLAHAEALFVPDLSAVEAVGD